ncbi:4'-phosphopantetheinyl transferase family protein [Achromobacter piechaudii]|nr:4'-phosphopantetheinyl transferase superfamily protein [Achromobacter piechaudii]
MNDVPLHRALALPAGIWTASMPISDAAGYLLAASRDEVHDWRVASAQMREQRRAEFVAGRVCAWRALGAAGVRGISPVLPVDGRLPVWPQACVGSISHSGAWAMACVAYSARWQGLGLDLQELIAPQTVADVQPLVASARELGRLAAIADPRHALTLLFSAKEALYKALYPSLRVFQDFDAAEVTAVDADKVELTLTRDWDADAWRAGQVVPVRYAWVPQGVLSACCIPANHAGDAVAQG